MKKMQIIAAVVLFVILALILVSQYHNRNKFNNMTDETILQYLIYNRTKANYSTPLETIATFERAGINADLRQFASCFSEEYSYKMEIKYDERTSFYDKNEYEKTKKEVEKRAMKDIQIRKVITVTNGDIISIIVNDEYSSNMGRGRINSEIKFTMKKINRQWKIDDWDIIKEH